jgi:beta-lactamase regulating signal transducer with metallopeptidase domain
MANHLWQSTVFTIVVGLLALALRKNQARTRYWLWMTASLKFLIPFSLLISIGSYLPKPASPPPAQLGMYSAIEEVGQPFAQQEAPLILPLAPTATPSIPVHLLPALLVAVWLSVVIVILLVWSVSWMRISKVMREAVPILEGCELEALRGLESVVGVHRRIKLRLSHNSMEPGIFGIYRPVLIWPEGISQHLEGRHIEAILAHEVCHVRRRDNLTAVLHMLVEAIFWFHPLVWWMGARPIEERERACDEEVTVLCKQPQVYAESILKVCKFCSESPLACVSGITGSDLKKRILHIMTERVSRTLGLGKKMLLVAVAMCVVAMPIVLGQAQAVRRMMLAAANAAPILVRTAVHAMIVEEQTPSTALIAKLQMNTAVPVAAQATAAKPEVRYGMAELSIPQPDAPAVITSAGFGNSKDDIGRDDKLVGARIDSKSNEDIVFFRMGWAYVLPSGLEFDKGETVVPYNGMHPGGTFGIPEWHVPLRKDATALLIFLEEVTLEHGTRWEADHKQIEAYYRTHSVSRQAMDVAAVQASPSPSQTAPTPTPVPTPTFEVSSVRQAAPPGPQTTTTAGGARRITGAAIVTVTSDRASYRNITLKSLLMRAYDLGLFQISGPAWIESERYDIVATIPEGTPKEDVPVMLQHLLAERFV